jgi:hypothetical protein
MRSPTEQLHDELILRGRQTRNAHPLYIVHELNQFFNFLNARPLLKDLQQMIEDELNIEFEGFKDYFFEG